MYTLEKEHFRLQNQGSLYKSFASGVDIFILIVQRLFIWDYLS